MEKLKSPSKKATAADAKMKASLKRSGGDANLSERESGTETPSGRKKIRKLPNLTTKQQPEFSSAAADHFKSSSNPINGPITKTLPKFSPSKRKIAKRNKSKAKPLGTPDIPAPPPPPPPREPSLDFEMSLEFEPPRPFKTAIPQEEKKENRSPQTQPAKPKELSMSKSKFTANSLGNQSTAPGPTSSAKGLLKRTRDTTAGAAGSDNEAADASGTETPGNATKKQKIKLKMGTDPKTAASAAGSPAGLAPPAGPASPAASPGTGNNASRAGSPTPVPASNSTSSSPSRNPPPPTKDSTIVQEPETNVPLSSPLPVSITADEVRAVLNLKPEGQLIAEFLSHFKGRVDKGSYQQLLALLKPLSRQKGKLICPK